MAANADCKIQISYGKDGLLLNIYAQDSIESRNHSLTTIYKTYGNTNQNQLVLH
jgi:hypothetical protein